MRSQTKRSKSTKVALSVGLFTLLFMEAMPASANDFFDDASITGNVFSWNRIRDRYDFDQDKYKTNLTHSTFNANVDIKSGYLNDIFAIELGAYGAWNAYIKEGSAGVNEIGFSASDNILDETWKDRDLGASFYKAQINLKYQDLVWLKAGYIQPSGQTLLGVNWSLMPGTYRGGEIGTALDFNNYGALSASYMIADQYKAPWYIALDDIKWDKTTKIDFVHSVGFKYDLKNNLVFEGAFGQAQKFMNQYFAKGSYSHDVLNNPLSVSYQFYGANDQDHDGAKFYDGLAWLQAATLQYQAGPVGLRLEGTIVKAEGPNGYFLQRMTPGKTSNGRLDIWWNSRSDFNANGEKAVFAEVSYDLGHLSNTLQGLRAAASYAYGWDAKPNSAEADQSKRVAESAWNLDLGYTVQSGPVKDSSVALHYTNYTNHSNNPSWGGGYGNMFQDEHDVKLIFTVPFTVFSPAK